MATTMRSVDTRFWVDGWVRKLNALDRYVFLYFLTNSHSSWCGVYELDVSMMSFETGIEENELVKVIMPRLSPKIRYVDGWVYIPNFEKYHANNSDKTKKGIDNAWKAVPDRIRLKLKDLDPLQGVSASASTFASALASTSAPTVEKIPRSSFGEFQNVKLTTEEHTKLVDSLNADAVGVLITELDSYIESTGKKYKSHYATLQNWARRRIQDHAVSVQKNKTKIAFI